MRSLLPSLELAFLFVAGVRCDLLPSFEISPLDVDEITIAAGIEHSCAIHIQTEEDVGGRVMCWGENRGQQSMPPPGHFIQVSTGRLHSCGLKSDETIVCWGVGAPIQKPPGLFDQVSSGDFHFCGLLKDQSVQCWGTKGSSLSKLPKGKYVQVSCGKDFSCAIGVDGHVECWGEHSDGQLQVPHGLRFQQISSSSGSFVCGVTDDNHIKCWGNNMRGQLDAPQDEKFILVSSSRLAACGIKMDRRVVCWGMKSGVTSAPTDIQFDELTLGWNHGCGIQHEDGVVRCWGDSNGNRLDIPPKLLRGF